MKNWTDVPFVFAWGMWYCIASIPCAFVAAMFTTMGVLSYVVLSLAVSLYYTVISRGMHVQDSYSLPKEQAELDTTTEYRSGFCTAPEKEQGHCHCYPGEYRCHYEATAVTPAAWRGELQDQTIANRGGKVSR